MKGFVKLIIVFVIGIFSCQSAWAQSKKELEAKKAKIQKEIEQTNSQLNQVSKNKSTTKEQITALKKKIALRQSLIATINTEIDEIGNEITTTSNEITNLETKLEQLKADYTKLILYADKNKNVYQRLMFVFGASDFNQAYQRLKIIQQIAAYRRKQAEEIIQTKETLTGKKTELQEQVDQKTQLKASEVSNKTQLEKEKVNQAELLEQLSLKEKALKKILAQKQKTKQNLDRAIERLIAKEIEKARKKTITTTATPKTTTSTTSTSGSKSTASKKVDIILTPEAEKLSNSFISNKGSLPWPVESGAISSSFGQHEHRELKGVIINNNGVDILTRENSSARVLFNGVVSGIISLPGAGKAVIVRHGDFFTVYSNLESVSVSTGQNLNTKQSIGVVASSQESPGRGEIHLEIWRNSEKLNPQSWIAR
ncbi:MAG: murein hydrolase activator EnvC family protein [Bacteroidota bacterium]